MGLAVQPPALLSYSVSMFAHNTVLVFPTLLISDQQRRRVKKKKKPDKTKDGARTSEVKPRVERQTTSARRA